LTALQSEARREGGDDYQGRGALMRLADLVDAFLTATQRRYSPSTRRAYRADLGRFVRRFPDLDAAAVTVAHLRQFLDAGAKLALATRARRRAALRACFGWAFRDDQIAADPTGKLERITITERQPWPLTRAQVEAILAGIPRQERRNRPHFTRLAETGLRIGEALARQSDEVHLNDRDGGYLRVIGQGNRGRVAPLIDAPRSVRLRRALLANPAPVGPLFRGDRRTGGRAGEPLASTTVLDHFTR
jgi:integrase/recombinase XerC/integrase/recombinase XerD